jgi:hypothetical protein
MGHEMVEDYHSPREFIMMAFSATHSQLLLWGVTDSPSSGDEDATRIEIFFTGVVAQKTRRNYSGLRVVKGSESDVLRTAAASGITVKGALRCWFLIGGDGIEDYVLAYRCDLNVDNGDWNTRSVFANPPGTGMHLVL